MTADADGGPGGYRDRWRALPTGLRQVLAAIIALHGVAHLAGTVAAFDAAADEGSLDYLGGAWTITDPTVLGVLGVAWAVVGAALVVTAIAVLRRLTFWPALLAVTAGASLVLSVLALWDAVIGVPINLVLIAFAVAGTGVRPTDA